jgi:hypothetical protein
MVLDNIFRGIAVVIIIMAGVIFFEDMYGVPINVKLAFQAGIGIDALIGTMLKIGKERGPLKKSRDKLNIKCKK